MCEWRERTTGQHSTECAVRGIFWFLSLWGTQQSGTAWPFCEDRTMWLVVDHKSFSARMANVSVRPSGALLSPWHSGLAPFKWQLLCRQWWSEPPYQLGWTRNWKDFSWLCLAPKTLGSLLPRQNLAHTDCYVKGESTWSSPSLIIFHDKYRDSKGFIFRDWGYQQKSRDFPADRMVENLPANAGDTGSIPGWGWSHIPGSN